ncbi:MAG: insulinase family protein [Acidobacteriota bacterium]|jgi:predicted Zn-dependent peptidase|nr:insulinase family protein [Acidobacteriota bacterium]
MRSVFLYCFRRATILLLLVGLSILAGSATGAAQDNVPALSGKRLLNDLQVTVAQTRNFGDAMTMGLVLRYGSAFDPEGKGGLAHLVSRMLLKATTDRTAKDIQAELEYLGASVEVGCDWDGIRLVLHAPAASFERALLLFYQIVGDARFEDADFEAVRQSILDELQKPPDPRQRIHDQMEAVLFQGTTYARPLMGTVESVSDLTMGDVRYFYRRFFSPNQAALEIVGDIDPVAAHQRIARIWGVWVRSDEIPFTFTRPKSPAGREVYAENDQGSPAAQFIIGGMFPRHEDPEYVNALLAIRVLQERLNKLLPTSLLTVRAEGRRLASPFYIQGQAAAEQALEQVRGIHSVIDDMKQSPVTDDELAAAQRQLTQEFNERLGTADGLCGVLLDAELYRLGSNYASFFLDRVKRSDAAVVQRAVSSWVLSGGEVFLIRGPIPVLKTGLESLGTVRPLAP